MDNAHNKAVFELNEDRSKITECANICVYITLICNFFILLFKPLNISLMVSVFTRVLIISIVFIAVLIMLDFCKVKGLHKVNALLILLFAWSLVCYLISGTVLDMKNIVSFLCFVMLPSYGVMYHYITNIKKIKKLIYISNAVYSLLFIALSFSNLAYKFVGEYETTSLNELTLGYNNPNETGMYLIVSFFIMIAAFFDVKHKVLKGGALIISLWLLYLIVQTQSRICIFLAILFLLISFTKFAYKNGKTVQLVCILTPLATLIITIAFNDILQKIMFMGDPLETGRIGIYERVIDQWNAISMIFGNFALFSGENLHNSYISVIGMLGIPTFLIYIWFLKKLLERYHDTLISKAQNIAFWGFMFVIIHGIAEAAFITSGTVYAGLVGLLFIVMMPDDVYN